MPGPDCRCERSFTCGYCLAHMKPWHWTPNDPAQPTERTTMPAPSRMFMGGYTAAAALSQAAREHTIAAEKAKQPPAPNNAAKPTPTP